MFMNEGKYKANCLICWLVKMLIEKMMAYASTTAKMTKLKISYDHHL